MSRTPFNRTKVVCTIGPASQSEEVLKGLMLEGMDVARLNFSHGNHEIHLATIKKIRKLNQELGNHTSILMDLQGPKIRVGILEEPFKIETGDTLFFDTAIGAQEGNILPMQYETFAKDVNPGDMILVDDGKVELKVLETDKSQKVKLEVVLGEAIGSRKGVNLPFTDISLPSITPKDRKDIAFGLKQDIDWIALSFVRTAEEIKELKQILKEAEVKARVIAKIEKPEALKNIDEIIEASDAIMVARGDLGVEIPMENVPEWQKIIISKSNAAAKPVIVATQMMESMIENSRPTRAETTDVANAVVDGADALMLSGETSVGKYPVLVVRSMQKIIASMEKLNRIYHKNMEANPESRTYLNDSINVSACVLSQQVNANAIVGMTVSGYTAFQIARCRPKSHIFIFTPKKEMLNILALVWGVRAFHYDRYVSTDETIQDTFKILEEKGLIRKDDIVINTASMPLEHRGRTNMLKISVID